MNEQTPSSQENPLITSVPGMSESDQDLMPKTSTESHENDRRVVLPDFKKDNPVRAEELETAANIATDSQQGAAEGLDGLTQSNKGINTNRHPSAGKVPEDNNPDNAIPPELRTVGEENVSATNPEPEESTEEQGFTTGVPEHLQPHHQPNLAVVKDPIQPEDIPSA